jgi:HK97 family phage prohead protease
MSKKEIRFLSLELRAEEDERGAYIEGYPIVFNQETVVGKYFREMIAPESVNASLLRDVALMIGHDFGMVPLAHSRRNTEKSTMQLSIDDHGVKMRALLDVEGNPKAKEAYSAIKRGDLSGMSFAFIVNKESWEDLDTNMPLRRITGIEKIYEVSLVAFPAYEGTSVQAASEGDALESVLASLESAKQKQANERAAAAADTKDAAAEQTDAEAKAAADEAEAERRRAVLERLDAERERRRAVLERLENLTKEVKHDEV